MLFKDERRLYHLGPSVGLLVDAFQRQNSPPEYLLAPLRRLAEDVGETTYLSMADGLDVVVVASVEGSHAVRVRGLHVGFRGSLHARGSGKLILAYAGDERIEAYLAGGLAPRTPNTIVDPVALRRRVLRDSRPRLRIRRRGVHRGRLGRLRAGAAGRRAIAAYTISTPTERFRARRPRLTAAVVAAAAAASSQES